MGASEKKSAHWSGSGQLRGGKFGPWFFLTTVRLFGLRLTYVLIVPVAIFYTFVSPDIRATMDYHRRIFGPQPWWKRRWLVFLHFLSFGRTLIDRVAILAGKTGSFTFAFEGEQHFLDALAEGRGVLVLTGHLGNWEAAGQVLSRHDIVLNVTGHDNELPAVRAMLNRESKAKFKLIPLTGAPTDVIPLMAALRRGEVVAMLADRVYESTSARVQFLGGEAPLPVGAYVMAALAGSPVVHAFGIREPGSRYCFIGFPPQRPQMPAHDQRNAYLRECAARFAHDMEIAVRRAPLQWYNFFPFWNQPAKDATRTAPTT